MSVISPPPPVTLEPGPHRPRLGRAEELARGLLRQLLTQRTLVIGFMLAVFVAFASWTVNTSGMPMVFGQQLSDWYNQLATGFLHGHLYIPTQPPAALVHLKQPYNPAYNTALAAPYHDLALYHDHFYLAWGPTAALVLFIPWRILQVGDASEPFGIVLFSSVGYLFVSLLVCWLVDRYLARVREWKLYVAVLGLGYSSVTLFLMRRPEFYEIAVTCAYCFTMIGLWALVTGSFGERFRPWRVGVGSASIGLAILSRVDLAPLVLLPAIIFLREWWRRGHRIERPVVGYALPSLLPGAIVVLAMLAYNDLRFGSIFQFGSIYQLASVEQLSNFNYQVSSILPGMFYYFVAPIQWTLAFPFFELAPPPYYPWVVPGYMQTEQVAGILTSTPILVVLFLAPFLLRKRLPRELAWLCTGLALAGLVIGGLISWGIPGTTMRYEVDFATLLLLPALICWMALTDRERPAGVRVVSRLVGTLLIVYGAIVGAGLSITGYYDALRVNYRSTYEAIGNAFGFVDQFATLLIGHPEIVKDTYNCANGECGTYAASLSHWVLDNGYDLELDIAVPTGGWQVTFHMFEEYHQGSGDKVLIHNASYQRTVYTTKGQETVAVPLQGGLDRIDIISPGKKPIAFWDLKTSRIPVHSH